MFKPASDVCQIISKMWNHYLVGDSHVADCRENRLAIVWEMLINLKSPIMQWWGKWKVIRNPYPGTDRHQKLISSSARLAGPIIKPSFSKIGWLLLSAHSQNDWRTNRTDPTASLAEVMISRHCLTLQLTFWSSMQPDEVMSKLIAFFAAIVTGAAQHSKCVMDPLMSKCWSKLFIVNDVVSSGLCYSCWQDWWGSLARRHNF